MPRVIAEDGTSQTIETDDGQIVVVPRGQFLADPMAGASPPQLPPEPPSGGPPPTPAPPLLPPSFAPLMAGGGPQPSAEDDMRATLAPAGMFAPAPAPAPAPAKPPAPAGPTADGFQQAQDERAAATDAAAAAIQGETDINAAMAADQDAARRAAFDSADLVRAEAEQQRQRDLQERQRLEGTASAAVDKHAATKIDEGRYWRDMSTGKQIAAAISLALSGIGEALQGRGGQNPALTIIEKYAAADIDAQQRERARLGDVAQQRLGQADRYAKLAGDRQADYRLRMAEALERGAQQIELAASKYGSDLAKVNGAKAAADLRGRKAEYLAQYAYGEWERGMKTRQLNEQVAARRASTALGYADLKQSGDQFDRRLAQDAKQFDRQMDVKAQEQLFEAAKLDQAGKGKEAEALRAQAKEERELAIGGGSMLAGKGADDAGRLLNKDGSLFKAPDQVSAQALRKQVTATVTAANLLDEMIRLRNEKGWSSDLLRSEEWRQLKSNMGAVILEAKNAGELGALSGPDMGLIEQIMGTTDPTEARDPVPGLKQARKNMVLKTKNALRVATYTGDFDVPDMSNPPAAKVDKDQAALGSRSPSTPLDPLTQSMSRSGVLPPQPDLTPQQLTGLQKLIARVERGDADAAAAAAALVHAAASAPNPKAREAAAAALLQLRHGGSKEAADILRERGASIVSSVRD